MHWRIRNSSACQRGQFAADLFDRAAQRYRHRDKSYAPGRARESPILSPMSRALRASRWRANARVLQGASLAEATTALGLVARPALIARMLFGAELSGVGIAVGRFAGVPLLTIALMGWPKPSPPGERSTVIHAYFMYNVLATVFLVYTGVCRRTTGVLLWPAVVIHAIFALLFGRASVRW